jgi:TRAP-type C4-dicarboxylate transport system substrate-binding protein
MNKKEKTMKTMKLIPAMLLVLLLAVCVQAEPYKMRLSHQMPETHFLADEAKYFKKLVEEKTDGQVVIEIYPAAQAFKPKELIGAVISGAIESGMSLNFQWAGIIPVMDVFLIPYFITDLRVIDQAIHGEVGARLFQRMEEKKVVPLMWLLQTRTNIYTSNDEPLIWPKDFKGKKMRGTSKMMNLGSEALGASTMSVSGPEVYTALQRGTLDIGLTGVGAALARHYYEVQKYGTVAHTFSVYHIIYVNPDFWNSIPADLQKTIRECAAVVQKKTLTDSETSKDHAIEELRKKMTIHIQTEEEASAWRKVMEPPVMSYFLENTGQEGKDLVEIVQGLKK